MLNNIIQLNLHERTTRTFLGISFHIIEQQPLHTMPIEFTTKDAVRKRNYSTARVSSISTLIYMYNTDTEGCSMLTHPRSVQGAEPALLAFKAEHRSLLAAHVLASLINHIYHTLALISRHEQKMTRRRK